MPPIQHQNPQYSEFLDSVQARDADDPQRSVKGQLIGDELQANVQVADVAIKTVPMNFAHGIAGGTVLGTGAELRAPRGGGGIRIMQIHAQGLTPVPGLFRMDVTPTQVLTGVSAGTLKSVQVGDLPVSAVCQQGSGGLVSGPTFIGPITFYEAPLVVAPNHYLSLAINAGGVWSLLIDYVELPTAP